MTTVILQDRYNSWLETIHISCFEWKQLQVIHTKDWESTILTACVNHQICASLSWLTGFVLAKTNMVKATNHTLLIEGDKLTLNKNDETVPEPIFNSRTIIYTHSCCFLIQKKPMNISSSPETTTESFVGNISASGGEINCSPVVPLICAPS